VERHYRCSICGTELIVTAASITETDAPKHCREEMTLTWQAGS
jgi:DNA-directed RNA polymerase subunit RPC12/RpoP